MILSSSDGPECGSLDFFRYKKVHRTKKTGIFKVLINNLKLNYI